MLLSVQINKACNCETGKAGFLLCPGGDDFTLRVSSGSTCHKAKKQTVMVGRQNVSLNESTKMENLFVGM